MKTIFYLFLLFCFTTATAQNREADSLILVQIYNNLDGPNWNNPENWLTSAPLEDWQGIRMFNDRVITLDIISQGARGSFPDEIIGLDQLSTFEIRSGEISGEIPSGLTALTRLNRFILNSTGIGGEIPNIWTSFDNLQTLSLSQNNLTGSLPDIGDDINLLSFQGNQLTGPIPASWENNPCPNLNISFNQLSGSFDLLSSWPNLIKIDLDGNDWTPGTLPTWIDDNVNLDRFSCNDCNLFGEIPTELDFTQHDFYDGMFLNNNELSGDISLLFNSPESNSDLYLSVSGNNFSGTFPADKVVAFSRIVIQSNDYTSTTDFPAGLELAVCNFKSNNFTYEGLIPVQEYVTNFENVPLDYSNQKNTLNTDTIRIEQAGLYTMESGDAHPSTIYQWYKNNQEIESETNETLIIDIQDNTSTGTYYCRMTNPDFPELDLQRNSIVLDVELTVSTTEPFVGKINIYPNPASELLSIEMPQTENNQIQYQLVNAVGSILQSGLFYSRVDIELTDFPSGIYIVQLKSGNKLSSQKIFKK